VRQAPLEHDTYVFSLYGTVVTVLNMVFTVRFTIRYFSYPLDILLDALPYLVSYGTVPVVVPKFLGCELSLIFIQVLVFL
jgi:hypothetical protein